MRRLSEPRAYLMSCITPMRLRSGCNSLSRREVARSSQYRRLQTRRKGEESPSAVKLTRAYPAGSDAQEANRNPGAVGLNAVASTTSMRQDVVDVFAVKRRY